MDIQGLINAMCRAGEMERGNYHLTLGDLVAFLRDHKGKGLSVGLGEPLSYRGYYSDLAFEAGTTSLDELLERCERAIGETFTGYKGGDFTMHERTPLWLSEYGETSGVAIIGIDIVDGKVAVHTKQVD